MTDDASPFFIRLYRFDDPDQDDAYVPRLDWRRRLVLEPGEEVLWRDEVDVAGYLLAPDDGTDELAWRLPRRAEVTVTDRRLAYVCPQWRIGTAPDPFGGPRHRRRDLPDSSQVVIGQIRWQWPARLDVRQVARPGGAVGAVADGSGSEHLLVVCDAVRATRRPALALSGGPLSSARALRRVATLIRRAVAGFRLANPTMVELAPSEWDALLAHAGLTPFADVLAGPARGIDLPGALPVEFTHRDDYYRRSARRRNAPPPSRSSPALNQKTALTDRLTVVSPTRRSGRRPGSAF